MIKCTGKRCPMQVGYAVSKCQCEGCSYRTAPMTNYDRIRNMNVEELAEGIATLLFAHLNKFNVGIGNPPQTMTEQEKAETKNAWLEWLESEVTEE